MGLWVKLVRQIYRAQCAWYDCYLLKQFVVPLTAAAMWIKWKRPGSRGRRGECVCTLNQNSTEPLNQLGLCLSRWFGKLGNSVIVRRLKGDHCLPEAGRVGGVLSWFSLLRPPFVSLRSCILTAALCQGPDCFGCVLWENQVPGFVKPLTMNGRARPQTHTHTHTPEEFSRG